MDRRERDESPKRRKLDDDRFAPSSQSQPRKHVFVPHRQRQQQASHRGDRTPQPHQKEFDVPEPNVDHEDSLALDRDWYAGDEFGHTFGDETHNPFGAAIDSWYDQQHEAALTEKKLGKRVTARAAQKQRDVDAWETNRMLTSGVAQRRGLEADFEDDEEGTRVHLMVHDLRPPFLDGRTIFSKQLEPVSA
ncbi:DEAH-box RNA helicase prp16, partial [Ascosphaera atra]